MCVKLRRQDGKQLHHIISFAYLDLSKQIYPSELPEDGTFRSRSRLSDYQTGGVKFLPVPPET